MGDGLVRQVETELKLSFALIEAYTKRLVESAKDLTQKEAAEVFRRPQPLNVDVPSAFLMRAGKPYAKNIWKKLYPKHETFRATSEDTA